MDNLITAQEVIELAFSENSNMREESVSSTSIRIAEIKYIKPVFGNMYSMLGTTYLDFTDEYIKPALAYFVKCEIISSIAIDMSNSGIAVSNPQYQSAASDKQRQRLYDSEMGKAKVLLDDALAYIETNIEEFPDFEGAIPKKHYRNGGIILGCEIKQPSQIVGNPVSRKEFDALTKELKNKVDKIAGKGLSTNDYTDEEKELLETLATREAPELSISISYQELVKLRDASQLTAGSLYRITDYQTTTSQENTSAANNPFDVVVIALSDNEIAEESYVVHSARDKNRYFRRNKLSAWKIWYSLDNDKERFAWADVVNGKGVIYRMIDEFGNDCPYDFKNILFKTTTNRENGYMQYDPDGYETWVYTFCGSAYSVANDEWSDDILDGSIEPPYKHQSDESFHMFHHNTMEPYILVHEVDTEDSSKCGIAYLNGNIFFGHWVYIENDEFNYGYCCTSVNFGNNCANNIVGPACANIKVMQDCHYNVFQTYSGGITLGAKCTKNNISGFNITLGNSCFDNMLEAGCTSIHFGMMCYRNHLGKTCDNITLGNSCFDNMLEAGCTSIHFGMMCYRNHLGKTCDNITLGNSCFDNKVLCQEGQVVKLMKNWILEDNVSIRGYIDDLYEDIGIVPNIHIHQGVKGENIEFPYGDRDYTVEYAISPMGEIRSFVLTELINS